MRYLPFILGVALTLPVAAQSIDHAYKDCRVHFRAAGMDERPGHVRESLPPEYEKGWEHCIDIEAQWRAQQQSLSQQSLPQDEASIEARRRAAAVASEEAKKAQGKRLSQ